MTTHIELERQIAFEKTHLKKFTNKTKRKLRHYEGVEPSDVAEVAALALAIHWHGLDERLAVKIARRGCPLIRRMTESYADFKRRDYRSTVRCCGDDLQAVTLESVVEQARNGSSIGQLIAMFFDTIPQTMRRLVECRLNGMDTQACAAEIGRSCKATSKLKRKLIARALEAGLDPYMAVERRRQNG